MKCIRCGTDRKVINRAIRRIEDMRKQAVYWREIDLKNGEQGWEIYTKIETLDAVLVILKKAVA